MSLYKPQQRPNFIGSLPNPDMGARSLPIPLVFTTSVISIIDDLALENENGMISAVQSIYIDNSKNQGFFSITFAESGQNIVVPPYYQGYWSIICGQTVNYTAVSYFPCQVNITFLNVEVEPACWNTLPGCCPGTPVVGSNFLTNTGFGLTIAAVAGRQLFLTHIYVAVSASTAIIAQTMTLTGLNNAGIAASLVYSVNAPANSAPPLIDIGYEPPLPSLNGALSMFVPAMGVGSTQAAAIIGFYL